MWCGRSVRIAEGSLEGWISGWKGGKGVYVVWSRLGLYRKGSLKSWIGGGRVARVCMSCGRPVRVGKGSLKSWIRG